MSVDSRSRWKTMYVACALGVAVLLGVAGCVRGSSVPTAAAENDAGRSEAGSYARGTAQDVYRSLRRGQVDTNQSLLTDTAVIVGPRAGDVYVGRTDAIVAVTDALGLGDRQKLRSRGLVAEGTTTGKAAWVVDRLKVGQRPYTVVAVLAQVDDLWYVVALHAAPAAPQSVEGGLAPVPDTVDPGAAPVVDLARAAAQSPRTLFEQLSDNKKTTVLGMGPADHLRGKKKVERTWKRKRKRPEPFELGAGVRAGVTPDGSLAWVMGDARNAANEAHRVMFVYERSDEAWTLVAAQKSAAFR